MRPKVIPRLNLFKLNFWIIHKICIISPCFWVNRFAWKCSFYFFPSNWQIVKNVSPTLYGSVNCLLCGNRKKVEKPWEPNNIDDLRKEYGLSTDNNESNLVIKAFRKHYLEAEKKTDGNTNWCKSVENDFKGEFAFMVFDARNNTFFATGDWFGQWLWRECFLLQRLWLKKAKLRIIVAMWQIATI